MKDYIVETTFTRAQLEQMPARQGGTVRSAGRPWADDSLARRQSAVRPYPVIAERRKTTPRARPPAPTAATWLRVGPNQSDEGDVAAASISRAAPRPSRGTARTVSSIGTSFEEVQSGGFNWTSRVPSRLSTGEGGAWTKA